MSDMKIVYRTEPSEAPLTGLRVMNVIRKDRVEILIRIYVTNKVLFSSTKGLVSIT